MKIGYDIYKSPIGIIAVVVDEVGVRKIELEEEKWKEYLNKNKFLKRDRELCKETITELNEYFKGKRKKFNLKLSIEGTEFRKKVWSELENIPYGETRSYSQIAENIGKPKAVRAIGQANKANNIPIIIPCHRVIGKNGNLTGFLGKKIGIKEYLLNHEKNNL